MQSRLLVPMILGVLAIGGGSFYGGTLYAKNASAVVRNGNPMRQQGIGSGAFRSGQGANGGFTVGEVVSKDATSFTLKLQDGGSKIIFYATSTTVGKTSTGTTDDITQGTSVTVNGTANQDGSVAAANVQIRPQGQGFPMRNP